MINVGFERVLYRDRFLDWPHGCQTPPDAWLPKIYFKLLAKLKSQHTHTFNFYVVQFKS